MSQSNPNDVTNQEILEAINVFATGNEKRLQKIEVNVGSLKSEVGSLKSEVGSLKSEVVAMKALMVTKDYLDEKLGLLRGDILVLLRKEDNRLTTLIQILERKKLLDGHEVQQLEKLEPVIPIAR